MKMSSVRLITWVILALAGGRSEGQQPSSDTSTVPPSPSLSATAGSTNSPAPARSAPVPVPAAQPPSAPAKFDPSAASSSIAIIEGDQAKGTGFVAKLKDGPALVTNGHVLSGQNRFTVQLLDGSKFVPEHFFFAEAYDLAVMRGSSPFANGGLDVIDNANRDVQVGDAVIVLGNALGAGVATQISGKVVAIGPNLVEVDAPFIAGNSGSPVIHVKSGKVLGVATYLLIQQSTGTPATPAKPGKKGRVRKNQDHQDHQYLYTERRFAYRLDNIPSWTEVPWNTFVQEGQIVASLANLTANLNSLLDDIDKNHQVDYGLFTGTDNPLRNAVSDYRDQMQQKQMSPGFYADAEKQFLWFVIDQCTQDISRFKPAEFSPYHKMRLQELIDQRQALAEAFKKIYDYQSSLTP